MPHFIQQVLLDVEKMSNDGLKWLIPHALESSPGHWLSSGLCPDKYLIFDARLSCSNNERGNLFCQLHRLPESKSTSLGCQARHIGQPLEKLVSHPVVLLLSQNMLSSRPLYLLQDLQFSYNFCRLPKMLTTITNVEAHGFRFCNIGRL